MSNNTTVQTKKEFLDMLANTIGDNEVVLWTQNTSILELRKKLNEKRVTFGFAADAFEKKDGVNDLMQNRSLFAAVICDRSILSEGANSLLQKKTPRKKRVTNDQ